LRNDGGGERGLDVLGVVQVSGEFWHFVWRWYVKMPFA
jgi:hypothetical protein